MSASGAADDSGSEEEGEDGGRRSGGRVSRGRQCNDSFRAAVDKSYDVVEPTIMDTGKVDIRAVCHKGDGCCHKLLS